jgi:1,4-dihydroxy-6-naphthoate synthase
VRERLSIGISPCPNDTFVFHGLLAGEVDPCGLDLAFVLADVEELNRKFARGDLDAAKCSFHAALALTRTAVVLPAGSALGFGVGPVLLARPGAGPLRADARVLCPGEGTTAHLLYRLFHPREGEIQQVVFSDILPRLARGEADFGVCIHEARFTYEQRGLALVEDLGATWERATGLPLPLGGILARAALGPDTLARLSAAIAGSLAYARAHRAEALATMRLHAQELDDAVLWKHVELYVNRWTADLGADGRAALVRFQEAAVDAGLAPRSGPPIEIFSAVRGAPQSP